MARLGRVLSEAVRLEAINIGTYRGQTKVLQGKFPWSGPDFAARTGVGAARRRVETAADIAGCAGILGEEAVAGSVKAAVGGARAGGGSWEGRGIFWRLKRWKLECPILPDGADGGGVEEALA